MMNKWLVNIFLMLSISGIAGVKVSKYAGAFLENGVGARPLAMGGAYSALANDVTSLYWNPAGLASMNGLSFHGMHAERFAGTINWDFIGMGMPLSRNRYVSLGFFRMGVDGIPITRLRDPSRGLGEVFYDDLGRQVRNDPYAIRYASDQEMALFLSYAYRKSSRLSLGGNVKVIRKVMDHYDAWGIGFDAGVQYRATQRLALGLVLHDALSTLVAWDTGQKELIPPHIRWGAAYAWSLDPLVITPVLDIESGFENRGEAAQFHWGTLDMYMHAGLEVNYKRTVSFRAGSDRGFITAGAGIRFGWLRVDYAFSQNYDLGESHRISLEYNGANFRKNM